MQDFLSEIEKRSVMRMSNEMALKLTKECLQTALIRLLSEKEMEKISITELVRVAGVSRTAFYSNYSSKEDLLLDWIAGFVEELTALINEAIVNDDLQGMFERVFIYIDENDKSFSLLVKGNLQNHLAENILTYLLEEYSNLNTAGKMLLSGWSGMMSNILLYWYQNDRRGSISTTAALCSCMTNSFLDKMREVSPEFLPEK